MSPVEPPRPTERADAARNRERVLASTRQLLTSQPIGSVTVDAIARHAGVGKGTVFRRFGSLEGLLEAALAPASEHLRHQVEHGLAPLGPDGEATPEQRLAAYLDALLDFVWDNQHFIRGLEGRRPFAYYDNPVSRFWIAELTRRLSAVDPDADAEYRALAVFTNLRADVLQYLNGPRRISRRRIRAQLHLLVG